MTSPEMFQCLTVNLFLCKLALNLKKRTPNTVSGRRVEVLSMKNRNRKTSPKLQTQLSYTSRRLSMTLRCEKTFESGACQSSNQSSSKIVFAKAIVCLPCFLPVEEKELFAAQLIHLGLWWTNALDNKQLAARSNQYIRSNSHKFSMFCCL